MAPALFALRLNLNETLKSGARGSVDSRAQNRFRQLLIVGHFTLATVLLSGATLFIYGLDDLNHRRSGWSSDRLVTGTFLLPDASYANPHDITAFQDRALEQLRALPGVVSAGLAAHPPFFNWSESRRFIAEGPLPPEPGREPAAMINAVSPGYLSTVGTSLIAGRTFDPRDQADSPRVFVINQSMARTLFPNRDPIGRRIARVSDSDQEWGEIVGVVEDVRNVLPEAVTVPFQLYVPMTQEPRTYNEVAVRLHGEGASALVPAIRALMSDLDPDLPIRNLKTAEDRVFRANYQLGVLRDMLTGFAVLGLGLASLGIYGVIARTMAQRTGEFGIRLALGAQVSDITRLVLGSGVRLALTGAVLGAIGGAGLNRVIAMGFANMQLNNPWMMVTSVAVLITVGLLASYLPARRAARINPIDSLRSE
ncbi:MAG: ABC transporter permease [Candidatus Synoicihabitans palmerolidicus]|nr:ABC transporter permease [Candidatus Synoicihabitans palmerolidicus]